MRKFEKDPKALLGDGKEMVVFFECGVSKSSRHVMRGAMKNSNKRLYAGNEYGLFGGD